VRSKATRTKRRERVSSLPRGGASKKRSVSLQKEGKANQFWGLDVVLVDAKDRIRVAGDRGHFFFELDICPDGVVCLMFEGSPISVEDAAIRVLDPFLFPQLQGRPES